MPILNAKSGLTFAWILGVDFELDYVDVFLVRFDTLWQLFLDLAVHHGSLARPRDGMYSDAGIKHLEALAGGRGYKSEHSASRMRMGPKIISYLLYLPLS